jgi:hypothetical protein
LINNNTRNLTNAVDQKALNASALYTHKFKKVGRTFSFDISEAYSQSDAKGFLKQNINYYEGHGQVDSTQLVDQYKTTNLQSQALNTNATWSEPLSKSFAIVVNYGIGIDNSSADRRSFSPSSPGNYSVSIDSLTSNYKLKQFSNQAGAIFNYKKGKTIINFGTRAVDVNLNQVDERTGSTLNRSFINWAPQASYQYRFSQQKSVRIGYGGNTTQPTLDQLQPVRTDNDYLNIIVGNPNLKPSFSNNFNVSYNSFKILTNQYIFINGNYSITSNPIVSDVTTDVASGKSTSEYFNLGKQTSSFFLGANFDKKLEKLDMNLGFSMYGSGNVYYNYINDALNKTRSYTFNPAFSLNKSKEKKYDFYLSGGPTYNISESSLQPQVNNNGAGFRADGQFNIYLPGKLQIGMNNSYEYTAATESFNQDFSKVLLNAFIIKSFLKSESLKLELWGNDLLNQNVGFSRTATSNMITQNSYTTIKRYFMLSISYDFTKMGGGAPKK